MNKTFPLLLILLIFLSTAYGQQADNEHSFHRHGVSVEAAFAYTPEHTIGYTGGGDLELKYYSGKFGVGLFMSFFPGRTTTDSFNYTVKQPELFYTEVGCIFQYLILHSKKIYTWVSLEIGRAHV